MIPMTIAALTQKIDIKSHCRASVLLAFHKRYDGLLGIYGGKHLRISAAHANPAIIVVNASHEATHICKTGLCSYILLSSALMFVK